MLFNSLEFLLFLPLVFIIYWHVCRGVRSRNLFTLLSSYIFYGWWDYRFLLLIALTSGCSYASGLLLERYAGDRLKRKIVSVLNISINLLILCYFKYFNFFVGSLSALLSSFGIELDYVTLSVILPVGISFYTFQALSYSIDVYLGRMRACRDVVAFFAYISYFPQLVAGPIERATNLLPQFEREREFAYDSAVDGLRQALWGFFKKVVIADNCAMFVDGIFSNYASMSGSTLLLGAFFFTIQIYCDFSGYSDIAIGVSRLFGIDLMRNFRYPYFATDIIDFWRRWHISLTTWFRDYVYIPLGGSRVILWKVIRNTLIIFLLSGLWHGSDWTYVIWGLYHALLFIPLLLVRHIRSKRVKAESNRPVLVSSHHPCEARILRRRRVLVLPRVSCSRVIQSVERRIADTCIPVDVITITRALLTFTLVLFGWVIFRSASISDAYFYLCGIMNSSLFSIPVMPGIGITRGLFVSTMFFVVVLFMLEWLHRDREHGLVLRVSKPYRYVIYILLILSIICFRSSAPVDFVYFQF